MTMTELEVKEATERMHDQRLSETREFRIEQAKSAAARNVERLRNALTDQAVKTMAIQCNDCCELDAFEFAFGEATQRLVEAHTLASLSPEIGWWALAQLHPDPMEIGGWVYLARRATLRLQQAPNVRPMNGGKRG